MMMMFALYYINTLSWIFIVQNNSPWVDMYHHSDILSWIRANQSLFLLFIDACLATNFIVFGLTRPGFDPMFYRTLDEHVNHYIADAVKLKIM